jgi:hypothetical protein
MCLCNLNIGVNALLALPFPSHLQPHLQPTIHIFGPCKA